jgi:hypothetical protein
MSVRWFLVLQPVIFLLLVRRALPAALIFARGGTPFFSFASLPGENQ